MNEPYCQFPLCLLSFRGVCGDGDTLLHILGYSIAECGKRMWSKYSLEEREHLRAHPPDWCTISLKEDEYLQAVIGCQEMELLPDHIYTVTAYHGAASRFVDVFEYIHGPDAGVRVRLDWVVEALQGTGTSFDEVSVAAAIYSKIGDKQGPVLITRDEIWWRSLGYKSKCVFEKLKGYGLRRTARQVRDIIDQLYERHFFARVTFGNRQTYYSHRLSQKELEDQVFEAKTYRARARQARIARDAELTRRIQAERRKRAGGNATNGATDTPL